MQQLKESELKRIYAGAGLSAAMINNFIKGASFILDLGRSLGSAIARARSKNFCQ